MKPTIRCTIAVLTGTLILIALAGTTKTVIAAAQSRPDYRSRTIYFLLADRFNPHHPVSAQLHNRGMRYIQDITLNDSNPLDNHISLHNNLGFAPGHLSGRNCRCQPGEWAKLRAC